MDITKQRIDLTKEVEGVWVDLDFETSVLVARMNNPRCNREIERLNARNRVGNFQKELSEEESQKLMSKVIAETILLDWKGMKKNGKILPYSKEAVIEIFNDQKLITFHTLIMQIAIDEDNYRVKEIVETVKKRKGISNGKKSGANK